jgi:hypothetical protein
MNALEGRLIAISVSDAPDRERLGFPQREIDRAIFSICTALVRAGAEIAYGGNVDPDGYTFKIFRHLAGAYAGSRDTPFHHFIPEPIARLIRYEDLYATLAEGRGVVRTEIARGQEFFVARPGAGGIRLGDQVVKSDEALAAWFAAIRDPNQEQAYSAARSLLTSRADARVIVGGKMGILGDPADAYAGAMPGIVEEAILALESDKPLVVLGAFGGAARDVAIALGLLDAADRVPRSAQNASYAPSIERISGLTDRIPTHLMGALREIAGDDRAEQTAYRVASLIADWISSKGLPD